MKHPYPGPVWKSWGSVTVGAATTEVGTAGPNTQVEFCYVSNASIGVGYVRCITNAVNGTATSAQLGQQLSEYGTVFPVDNLNQLSFRGQTGDETVTINYALPNS